MKEKKKSAEYYCSDGVADLGGKGRGRMESTWRRERREERRRLKSGSMEETHFFLSVEMFLVCFPSTQTSRKKGLKNVPRRFQ